MINRFSKLGLAAAAIGMIATGTAFATPIEMQLSVGGGPAQTFVGITPGSLPGATSVVFLPGYPFPYTTGLGGWSISTAKTAGDSFSPSVTPSALDLSAFTASCSGGSCQPLTIAISDTDFAPSVSQLSTTLSNTQTGSGSVTQWAYADQGNAYFGKTDLIGTLSLNGTGALSMSGLAMPVTGPYSLTLIDTFNSCTTSPTTDKTTCGNATFSIDTNIAAAPEPGTLALFGAGLLGCAIFVGRRRRASEPRV